MTYKSVISFFVALSMILIINSCDDPASPSNNNPIDSTKILSKGMVQQPNPINRNYGHGKFNRVAVELENGNILVAGGYTYNDMSRVFGVLPTEIYDTTKKKWEQLEPLVTGTQSQDKIFLLNDGRVFFKYGYTANNTSLDYGLYYYSIFDPQTKKWQMKYNPECFEDRAPIQDCCVMYDGTVFILTKDYYYTWNPNSDTYTSKVKLNYDATSARCIRLFNGEILVCGGLGTAKTSPTDYCFTYPSNKISKMLSRKSSFDIITFNDNKAYILTQGNEASNGSQNSSPYQYYDYESNTWYPINVNLMSLGHGISQGTVVFPSKKGIIISEGYLGLWYVMFDFNSLTIEPNRIFEYSIFPISKKLISLLALRNGKIFILGYDPENKLPECFIYDSKVDYQ